MLLVSVLFTEHLPLFSGAILSATNNSMAGEKLQLRDEKRFEQPQLASSQAIGAIGFPFEAIGKRFSLSGNRKAIFIVAKLQLRGLGGKIAVDRNSNADKIPIERKQIRHRALRSCMSHKFSLELVHGLYFVFLPSSCDLGLPFDWIH